MSALCVSVSISVDPNLIVDKLRDMPPSLRLMFFLLLMLFLAGATLVL